MNNIKDKLTIFKLTGSTYTDYSMKLYDFTRDIVAFAPQTTDTIYMGYYKPIRQIFTHFYTPNTTPNTLSIQYWNGASFADVDNLYDDTFGFTRSGYIGWDENGETPAKSTINGKDMFWYKVTCSANCSSGTKFTGINILFSWDSDIAAEWSKIMDSQFLDGQADHILAHVAARDEIVQKLRNKGMEKANYQDPTHILRMQIGPWDLLSIDEIRNAAKLLAMSKILFNVSDNADDIFMLKSNHYNVQAMNIINAQALSIDFNDDGVTESSEKLVQSFSTRMRR